MARTDANHVRAIVQTIDEPGQSLAALDHWLDLFPVAIDAYGVDGRQVDIFEERDKVKPQ